jgi:hypothetical protein
LKQRLLHAVPLRHLVLELLGLLGQRRRPGRDLLLQRLVQVAERLVPRVQLRQGRGLRGHVLVLGGVQLADLMLPAPGP